MARTFISYSRRDAVFADKIAKSLLELGVDVWIDTQDIQPGMKWSKAVQQGLDASDTMLVIVSQDAMESTNVEDEWQYYLDQGKQVIPLFWRPAKLHFQLNRFQYIDFSQQSFDSAFTLLLTSLGMTAPADLVAGQRAFSILTRHYEDWVGLGKDSSQLLTADTLDAILGRIIATIITVDLAEYLLYSAAIIRMRDGLRHLPLAIKTLLVPDIAATAIERVLGYTDVNAILGMLNILADLDIQFAASLVNDVLDHAPDIQVLQIALNALDRFGYLLSETKAHELFNKYPDWVIRSFALKRYKLDKAALLFSDGTDYAHELGQFAEAAGYTLTSVKLDFSTNLFLHLNTLKHDLFAGYDLIILVRGEHFSDIGGERLYPMLRKVVEAGGLLFATAWVGWETKSDDFAEILPFRYDDFKENVNIKCVPTDVSLARDIFDGSFEFMTSYEPSSAREGSVTLLQTTSNVPIFGYRRVGTGICYYLNSCEHSCLKPFPSPFQASPAFRELMLRMFDWIANHSES